MTDCEEQVQESNKQARVTVVATLLGGVDTAVEIWTDKCRKQSGDTRQLLLRVADGCSLFVFAVDSHSREEAVMVRL